MAERVSKRARLQSWIYRPADDVPRARKRDILLVAACKIVGRVSHPTQRGDATTRDPFVSSMFSTTDLTLRSSPPHPTDPINALPLAGMLDQLVHVLTKKIRRFRSQEFNNTEKSMESTGGRSSQATEVALFHDPLDWIEVKELSDVDEEGFYMSYGPPRLSSLPHEITLNPSGFQRHERNPIANEEHPLYHEETRLCDQISDSSTDSTHSETETDWEDDESDGSYVDFEVMKRIVDSGQPSDGSVEAFHDLVLTPVKQQMVDRLMEEFWVIFDLEWQTNVTSHAGTPDVSTTSQGSGPGSSTQRSASGSGTKRRSTDHRDQHSEDDEQENAKRRNISPSSGYESHIYPKFACPYRKHDPRKYNITDWRTCALTPQSTIARVKGHLYRHHRIFQCLRCKQLFKSQDELDTHFTTVLSCELSSDDVAEGITVSVEKRLRSRKKTHRDQSEEDRWREIYQILFPEDDTPSPYFDPIQEELLQSPESLELANYGDYSRRELPRLFRSLLETAVNDEAQPIEERLRGQLTSMIQECQDRVFSNYRSLRATQSMGSSAPPESQANSPNATVQMAERATTQQPTSLGPHLETRLHAATKGGQKQGAYHGQQGSWDSGYGSNKSASASSLSEDLEKLENMTAASTDIQSPTPAPTGNSCTPLPPKTKILFFNSVHDRDMAQFFSMEDAMLEDGGQDVMDQELLSWDSGWGIESLDDQGDQVL